MKGKGSTREYLIAEMAELRQRLADLGATKAVQERTDEGEQEDDKRLYRDELLVRVSDAIISTDMDLTVQSWTGAAEVTYGWQADEVLGKQMDQVIATEYPLDDLKDIVELLSEGEGWQGEVVQKRKDGTVVYTLSSLSLLQDGAGNPVGVVAINRDITGRKRSEQLLHALNQAALAMEKALTPEDMFTAAAAEFKDLGFACIVLPTDESQSRLFPRYLSYDSKTLRAAEKLAGHVHERFSIPVEATDGFRRIIRERETVYRESVEEALGQVLPKVARKIANRMIKMLKSSKSIGAPLIVEDEVVGALAVQSDDLTPEDVPAVTAFAHQMAAAWHRAQLYEQAQQEIAERKRIEEALRESEARYRSLFETLPVGLYRTTPDGRILDGNPALVEMLGYADVDSLLNADTTTTYVDPKDQELWQTLVESEGRVHGLETRFRRFDGGHIWVRESARAVEDNEGRVVHYDGVLEDITEQKRVGEALLRESDRARMYLDIAGVMIVALNADREVTLANRKACEILGYSEEEILGKNWVDHFIPERLRDEIKTVAKDLISEDLQPAKHYENPIVTRDGEERLIAWHNNPLRDEQGVVIGTLSSGEDITERRRAEQLLGALNQAALAMEQAMTPEEIFAAVSEEFDKLDLYCVVFLADEGGTTLHPQYLSHQASVVEMAEKLTGLKPEKLSVPVVSAKVFRRVMHDRRTVLVEDSEQTARELLPGPLKRLAGQLVRLMNAPRFIAAPLIVEDEVIGVLSVQSHDLIEDDMPAITAFAHEMAAAWRKTQLYQELQNYAGQLEGRVQERTAQLQTQNARLEAILASTADGILVSDETGEIIQTNPVAQTWLAQTLSPEDAGRLREVAQGLALRAEEGPEEILELTGLDLQLSAAPILEPGMGGSTSVVAVHDVSYLKMMDRLKSRFVSNVSHQLRTPITTIKLLAALMRRQPDRWEEYLEPLEQEAERQAQLVEDILEISRIEGGRMELELRRITLDELTDAVVESHQVLAKSRDLVLEHRPAEPGPVALVDPDQIMKVLNNLVVNGLNYTPEGGRVVVSTDTEEAEGRVWATVTVADTGIGIPLEEMPHVLDRFFRGVEPREMQIPGTGLGLAIVNEIVELHGGQVTVESQVGEGSTFIVWLPLA